MVIGDHSTTTILIELEMVEVDVILGTDCLCSCYVNVDCRAKMVQFNFLEGSAIEWKGVFALPKGRFISYLKTSKMIAKGMVTLESVPMVNEFPDKFPDELPRLPPGQRIDFFIDIVLGTQPISIPTNRMGVVLNIQTHSK
ncbi:uncharacterized protein LOC142177218 [Nicotiana tabacum]|uniref:Uncharacterized protein LOC142177218 n=1 Tax=Nicotiana tabacum TaxID=4097 RepID=A0AC58TX34_TOBAC